MFCPKNHLSLYFIFFLKNLKPSHQLLFNLSSSGQDSGDGPPHAPPSPKKALYSRITTEYPAFCKCVGRHATDVAWWSGARHGVACGARGRHGACDS
ncbi:hypothetical protein V6Z12_A03G161900 [Gossypium hirsutum]